MIPQINADNEPLRDLITECLKSAYSAPSDKADTFLAVCLSYFETDYNFKIIDNSEGVLCNRYPTKIVVLESHVEEGNGSFQYDISKMSEYMSKARQARCRTRFPVPVILYKNKQICRSSTIACGAELIGRNTMEYFTGSVAAATTDEDREMEAGPRCRAYDVKLLRELGVKTIFDLMVEQRKVKFYMTVTSSEKVDNKENPDSTYSDFSVCSIPYPGCEFFTTWRDSSYATNSVHFDWKQKFVDATFELSSDVSTPLGIDFQKYKEWPLADLTRNYLKLLLHHIEQSEDESILIHCISGWDRTPLFISLIRLSLWADFRIHKSLGPAEILYLTIAYDWYLFGHNFPNRATKGEEIFFFCFYFLNAITSDEFIMEKVEEQEPTMSEIIGIAENMSLSTHSTDDSKHSTDDSKHISDRWQLVSGCGSVGKSVNVSPQSGTGSSNSPDTEAAKKRARRKIFPDSPEVAEVSSREQRLTAVRQLFLKHYHSCEKPDTKSSRLQQFVESASKIGNKIF